MPACPHMEPGLSLCPGWPLSRPVGHFRPDPFPLPMTNLYLLEQGSVLRKTGQRLIVRKDGEELLEIEAFKVNTIFLFGNIHVTTPALTQLLANNIELALLTRNGRLKGQVTPPMPKNVILRIAQYECSRSDTEALALAKSIVAGKITNGRHFLHRHHRNRPDAGLDAIVAQLDGDLARVRDADSLASLLGYEGDSARTYFAGMARACTGELDFTGRKRRPPPDPVNALLSFGYTLVGAELASLLDAMGFDPHIGIFHQPRYGRASLALDLLEEFRTDAVDRLVLGLVNRRVLNPRHFREETQKGGVRLTSDGMKIFFRAYETHLAREFNCPAPVHRTTLRKAFRFQAEQLSKALVDGIQYVPFRRQ